MDAYSWNTHCPEYLRAQDWEGLTVEESHSFMSGEKRAHTWKYGRACTEISNSNATKYELLLRFLRTPGSLTYGGGWSLTCTRVQWDWTDQPAALMGNRLERGEVCQKWSQMWGCERLLTSSFQEPLLPEVPWQSDSRLPRLLPRECSPEAIAPAHPVCWLCYPN